jgi:hypothetical protein
VVLLLFLSFVYLFILSTISRKAYRSTITIAATTTTTAAASASAT